jgi:hypothetical protein
VPSSIWLRISGDIPAALWTRKVRSMRSIISGLRTLRKKNMFGFATKNCSRFSGGTLSQARSSLKSYRLDQYSRTFRRHYCCKREPKTLCDTLQEV